MEGTLLNLSEHKTSNEGLKRRFLSQWNGFSTASNLESSSSPLFTTNDNPPQSQPILPPPPTPIRPQHDLQETQKTFRIEGKNQRSKMNTSFEMFRKNNLLIDINIVVKGTNYYAHQMILSAASPYFKEMILSIRVSPGWQRSEHNFITIVLDKCEASHFSFLLDYIYLGEIKVPEKDLAGVLKAAEDFQICGLYSPENNEESRDDDNTPMDLANFKAENEENPLVINESDDIEGEPESKRSRTENWPPPQIMIPPKVSVAPASHLLQNPTPSTMANNFSTMESSPTLNKSEVQNQITDITNADPRRNSLPSHMPSMMSGMSQEMFQKLQQTFINNTLNNGISPNVNLPLPLPLPLWDTSSNPALMAQAQIGASFNMSPAEIPSSMMPSQISLSGSPNLSNFSRGIPSGISASGKPAVSCEICGKYLADASSLYRHRKIHIGDKPHKCPYCGRCFIQRYNLTQHIKTHFKTGGINSLSNDPATLANFLNHHRSILSQYQIPEEMINGIIKTEGFVPEDQDNTTYLKEQIGNENNAAIAANAGVNINVTAAISRENSQDNVPITTLTSTQTYDGNQYPQPSTHSSSKTGSSRKQGQPKKLILHSNMMTPPESHSPSPESFYVPANRSPRFDQENKCPTPSSSRSSLDGNGSDFPMDFSKSRQNIKEEEGDGPLVINESDSTSDGY